MAAANRERSFARHRHFAARMPRPGGRRRRRPRPLKDQPARSSPSLISGTGSTLALHATTGSALIETCVARPIEPGHQSVGGPPRWTTDCSGARVAVERQCVVAVHAASDDHARGAYSAITPSKLRLRRRGGSPFGSRSRHAPSDDTMVSLPHKSLLASETGRLAEAGTSVATARRSRLRLSSHARTRRRRAVDVTCRRRAARRRGPSDDRLIQLACRQRSGAVHRQLGQPVGRTAACIERF